MGKNKGVQPHKKDNVQPKKKLPHQPSKAKNKVFAEEQGLAHLLQLSQSIAQQKSSKQAELVAKAQARQAQAQQAQKEQDSSLPPAQKGMNTLARQDVAPPPPTELAQIKAQIKAQKREKRKQRKEGRKAQRTPPAPPQPTSTEKTDVPPATKKAKPRKSVSFAV